MFSANLSPSVNALTLYG